MQKYNITGSVPLLLPLAAFVGGLLLAHAGCPLWFVLLIAVVAVTVYMSLSRMVGVLLVVTIVGMLDGMAHREVDWPAELADQPIRCRAVVNEVSEGNGSRTLTLVVDSVNSISNVGDYQPVTKCKVSAMIPSFLPELREGDRVRFCSRFRPLESRADLPDEKDVTGYLRQSGVCAVTTLPPDSIVLIGTDDGVYWRFRQIKHNLKRTILQSQLSDTAGAFLVAVLLGDDSVLAPDVKESLTGVGLAHVFALSGLHVGIIAMMMTWMLWPLYLLRWRRARLLSVMALLWCYALLTGLSPSVTRAVIMASVFMLSVVFERRSAPVNSLCFSALIILTFDPMALWSLSFQMSFVAVAAILAAAWVLDPLRVRMSPLVFGCVSFVAVSVAAVAGTGILSAYHFHVMPLWFIIANIGVALFLPVIICSGILLVLCTWMGFDVAMLCSLIDVCVTAVCRIAGWVSAIPGALLSGIYFSAWLMIPYFGIVACLLLWARFHRWIWPVAVIMLSVAIVALHVSLHPTYPSSELFVTRERYHTNIIMRCGDVAVLFTTARSGSRGDVIDECLAKYSSYLERRGVSGLTDMTERLVADGNVIEFGSMLIRVVDSWIDTDILPDRHYDYLLVCRGFKGDIVNLAEQLSADTVLLSADINSIRCSRYVSELRDAGVAYRSLRDGALHLVEPANCR